MQDGLIIKNLNYGVYKDFNLIVKNNKLVSIIGSNNSGKSTLFNLISGIIPTTNIFNCYGIDLNRTNVNRYIRQLGLVFNVNESVFLFDKVYDELSYPLKNLGYSKNYIIRSISRILNLFGLDIKDKRINELSLYERQCLLFCLALIHNPKVLIIDDVFNNMNKNEANKIIMILKSIKKLNMIINFSSSLEFGNNSEYIYILDNGDIKLEGTYKEVIKESNTLVKLGIELPFVVNLSNKLKEEGIVKKDYFDLEDLVSDVWG